MNKQLRHRSSLKELLDNPNIPLADLYCNLDELHVINSRLGGYSVSRKGICKIAKEKKIKTVMDIGFGGGHSILELASLKESRDKKIFYYGVDLKDECIMYATEKLNDIENKKLICCDYKEIPGSFLKSIDVLHCSLFLHHLSNEEIIEFFKLARANGCTIVANDLHRHWLAYYSIKWITAFFSKSYLVKNDAPVSVLRGFKSKELAHLLKEAGFTDFTVKWCWAFRYMIIARK
jgi:ubiquinone/menaquinone biosynthesis C-methylase UbiE